MQIWDRSHGAVDPYLLALRTQRYQGFKYRPSGFTYPVLPSSGLSAMGNVEADIAAAAEFDPEPISRTVLQIVVAIEEFFHIGAGRNEADIIVPIQNRLVSEVIAPISAAVSATSAKYLTQGQLSVTWNALLTAEAKWFHFLHDTDWVDGRAAQQAESTLAPYFAGLKAKIELLMQSAPAGGVVTYDPGVPPIPGTTGGGVVIGGTIGSSSTMLMVGLGGFAIYMFSRRGKR